MTLAEGVEFLRWAADRFDDAEACHCLMHPGESASALLELLERSARVLQVQQGQTTAEGALPELTPRVLIDLSERPDLVDLVRVATLESAGRSSQRYVWHAIRRGCVLRAVRRAGR